MPNKKPHTGKKVVKEKRRVVVFDNGIEIHLPEGCYFDDDTEITIKGIRTTPPRKK